MMMRKLLTITTLALVLAACSTDNADISSDFDGTGRGGSLARFAINSNTLYTVYGSELKVFDITNATVPEAVGATENLWQIETVFSRGEHLFLGTPFGMTILNVTEPLSPGFVSSFEHAFACDPVVADQDYAYITLRSIGRNCGQIDDQLNIVDIKDLFDPRLEEIVPMDGPKGLGIDGDLLFVCDLGLKVYDKSDIRNLRQLQYFDIPANDVIPLDGVLMVVADDGLYQYDYSGSELNLLSKVDILPEVIAER